MHHFTVLTEATFSHLVFKCKLGDFSFSIIHQIQQRLWCFFLLCKVISFIVGVVQQLKMIRKKKKIFSLSCKRKSFECPTSFSSSGSACVCPRGTLADSLVQSAKNFDSKTLRVGTKISMWWSPIHVVTPLGNTKPTWPQPAHYYPLFSYCETPDCPVNKCWKLASPVWCK